MSSCTGEAKSVRARSGADKAVGKILALFERYEQDVVQGEPNSPALKMFTAALDDDDARVRDVMVKTSPAFCHRPARAATSRKPRTSSSWDF